MPYDAAYHQTEAAYFMHGNAVMIYTPYGVIIYQTSYRFGLDKKFARRIAEQIFGADNRTWTCTK